MSFSRGLLGVTASQLAFLAALLGVSFRFLLFLVIHQAHIPGPHHTVASGPNAGDNGTSHCIPEFFTSGDHVARSRGCHPGAVADDTDDNGDLPPQLSAASSARVCSAHILPEEILETLCWACRALACHPPAPRHRRRRCCRRCCRWKRWHLLPHP